MSHHVINLAISTWPSRPNTARSSSSAQLLPRSAHLCALGRAHATALRFLGASACERKARAMACERDLVPSDGSVTQGLLLRSTLPGMVSLRRSSRILRGPKMKPRPIRVLTYFDYTNFSHPPPSSVLHLPTLRATCTHLPLPVLFTVAACPAYTQKFVAFVSSRECHPRLGYGQRCHQLFARFPAAWHRWREARSHWPAPQPAVHLWP